MGRGWIMAFVICFAAIPCVAAAQAEPPAALRALVASPQYQANIARLFASLPPDVFQRCAGLVSNGSRVTVMAPISFAADGYPIAGMWKQSFPVSGCGNDTTINLFFVGKPDEKILSIVGAPGDTHADPVLQRDAVRYVMIAAQPEMKDCNAAHLRTTQYDGRPSTPKPASASGREAAKGPWRETWTVAGCSRMARVDVDFIPDATGTTISAHPAKSNTP